MNFFEKFSSLFKTSDHSSVQHSPTFLPQPSLSEFAQTLVETSPDWELWLDTNLQLLFTNKKCLDYTGYTQDEFHKDPSLFLKILHPDDRKDISNQLQKNSPTHQTFSLRFQKKDKQISNVAFIKITIQEKQQKSPVYRLISRITPNTPTPVSQIDLKDFFLLISKVTNSPILLLDQNFTIQFASPSALILLEKNQSELLNSPFTKLFPTSSQLDLKNLVTSSAQIEYELPSKKSINLLLSFHPIPSPTLSYLLIINDLSKKSQNNLQLLKNVDRLREAERIAKLGHWIIELSTGNLEWSEQTYLMFGIPVGTPVNAETFFSTVHPDDRELVRKAWQNALDSGQTYEIEHRIIVDGEVRWMRERAETSRIEEGKIVGTVLDITEQKLTQLSLQRERDLFNSGPVFTIEWANQPGWPVRRVSSNVSSILGYSPEELTAESFRYSSLIHPEDLPRIEQEVQDHIQNNNNFYEQYYRMRTRSGEYRWFLDHTRVLRNEKNEVIGFQGYIQDDTPRKLAEETMRLHEERFRKLFNIASIGMAITDIETGRFVAVNDALAQATGYSKKELTQKTFWDITPPGYSSVDNAALLSLQQTGRCGPVEKAFLRKDGSQILITFHSILETDQYGNRLAYSFIEDITQKRRSEQQMRLLSSAVEQSSSAILITDITGKIIYANPALCNMTGYSPHELLGKNPRIFKSPKNPPEIYSQLWQTILSGKPWHGELINRHKNGTYYWESIRIYPVSDNNNLITHFVAIKEDITNRKRAEAQLQAYNLELEAALAEAKIQLQPNPPLQEHPLSPTESPLPNPPQNK